MSNSPYMLMSGALRLMSDSSRMKRANVMYPVFTFRSI